QTLVIPYGRILPDLLLDGCEVCVGRAKVRLRSNLAGLHPAGGLIENYASGTAAVVADAVEIQHLRHAGSLLPRLRHVCRKTHRAHIAIGISAREVGEHLAAVRRFPPEEL